MVINGKQFDVALLTAQQSKNYHRLLDTWAKQKYDPLLAFLDRLKNRTVEERTAAMVAFRDECSEEQRREIQTSARGVRLLAAAVLRPEPGSVDLAAINEVNAYEVYLQICKATAPPTLEDILESNKKLKEKICQSPAE